jgi:hypothetical protein
MTSDIIKLENIATFNWAAAMRGMRNPLESWSRSESMFSYGSFGEGPMLCDDDLVLALKLINADRKAGGSANAKFMRQIFISFDLVAPWYFWKEYATYKVGTAENSTSTMHKLGGRELTHDDFVKGSPHNMDEFMLSHVNYYIQLWRDCPVEHKVSAWRDMISVIPGSYLYRRTCSLNYEVLRCMYRSRKNHKQQEWRDFLNWLLSEIPYPLLITEGLGS